MSFTRRHPIITSPCIIRDSQRIHLFRLGEKLESSHRGALSCDKAPLVENRRVHSLTASCGCTVNLSAEFRSLSKFDSQHIVSPKQPSHLCSLHPAAPAGHLLSTVTTQLGCGITTSWCAAKPPAHHGLVDTFDSTFSPEKDSPFVSALFGEL